MKTLTIATHNRGKLREYSFLFSRFLPAHTHVSLLCMDDFPSLPPVEENGTSFYENARIKALTTATQTGTLALADDSGLCVDALDGAPGIYSARYSGEDATDEKNCLKLLKAMTDVPEEERNASFVCVIALAAPGELLGMCEGICRGTIGFEPHGWNGFGYDPLFIKKEYGMTFAQLPQDTKNTISHRALAFEKAAVLLDRYLCDEPHITDNHNSPIQRGDI